MTAPKKLNHSRWILLSLSSNGHMLVHLLVAVFLHGFPYSSAEAGGDSGGSDRQPRQEVDTRFAVIIFVPIIFIFVLTFVSICIFHWNRSRGQTVENIGVGYGRRRVSRGLDREAIETLPTFAYSTVKTLKIGECKLECAICLNEFEDDETLRLIPHCNHIFHQKCVDEWLPDHATCPVCRTNLATEPSKAVSLQRSDTISSPAVDLESGEIDRRALHFLDESGVSSMMGTNKNLPRRTKSTELSRWHSVRLLPRSNSAGHAVALPNGNLERFTLRLPEDVRNALLKSSLVRMKPYAALRRARSSREGYGSSSVDGEIGRLNRLRRVFSSTGRFLTRTGSVNSPNGCGSNEVGTSNGLAESINKSTISCSSHGNTDVGERSSERLWPNTKV